MSQRDDRSRRRTLIGLAVAAGVLALTSGGLTLASETPYAETGRRGAPVWPDFTAGADDIAQIRVELADDAYTLTRQGEVWGMDEADGFPVRMDRLSVLAEALATLTWDAVKTRDPEKLDRIALGDPRDGGSGARLEARSADGSKKGALITGRRGDKLYGRRPGESQSFRLAGELPPLYTRDGWRDLRVVEIRPEAISGARLTEAGGDTLLLTREQGSGLRGFKPAPPHQDDVLISSLSASGAAMALGRFAPINVKRASNLDTSPVANHVTTTFDGLEVEAKMFREPDGLFITLRAVEAGEGAARAEAINKRAAGWAFELSELDWADFAAPIVSIVNRPAPPLSEE